MRAAVAGAWILSSGAVLAAGPPFGQAGRVAMPPCAATPAFSDYASPVGAGGKRPLLKRNSAFSRRFVTRLSDALREEPVNLAGHFIVTTFGCGSGCVFGGIIDASTGQAYELPWAIYLSGYTGDWDSALKHDAGSRLVALRGALNEADEPPLERYFEWTGTALKPVCAKRLQIDPRTGMVK